MQQSVNSPVNAAKRLGGAFEDACVSLGLGPTSMNVADRERLARLMMQLVATGERDVLALKRRAIHEFEQSRTQPSVRGGRRTL